MKSIVTVVAVLIAATYGQQEECPQGAEFIISFDNVVQLANFVQNIPDPDLSFFRDVLRFAEQEIETATQSAIEHFNTTFGLDFSESVPNEEGERFFQNASFSAGNLPFTATAKANRWLVNAKTKSRCFDARIGWFGVRFLGNQVLYGTYGGSEGRMIGPTSVITGYSFTWGVIWIDACPHSALLIQTQSSTSPAYATPDGVTLETSAASLGGLGNGINLSILYVNRLPPDETFARVRLYSTVIFPADEIP